MHRPLCVIEEVRGDLTGLDGRVAPGIETDVLGQQLRAHSASVAGDGVDDEGVVGLCHLTERRAVNGSGRKGWAVV